MSNNAKPNERRRAIRRQPAFGTLCRLLPDSPDEIEGLVWNLSATGVSVLLAQPPVVGDILSAELVAEPTGLFLPVLLRVVTVRPVKTGDHVLGAEFLRPLASAELDLFLTPIVELLFPAEVGS